MLDDTEHMPKSFALTIEVVWYLDLTLVFQSRWIIVM